MLRIATAFFAAFLLAAPADASRRVALVIGNSAYAHAPALPNPKNDASDMAAKLEGLGFAVVSGVDLDLAGVKAKVREFRAAATSADLALFFYAGHGIQVDGVNYMIPVDADIADEAALDFEAVEMEAVLKAMADTPTLVVLLDACRDNPFGEKLARSLRRGGRTRNIALGKGLAQLDAGTGTLVAFSTQPGNVALDGEGRNSPFTAGLLKHLGQPGMSITDELILVRNAVLGATANRQRPWDSSSLTGRVVLNAAAAQELAPRAASQIEDDFEIARRIGTKTAWEAFIARHESRSDLRVATARRELEKFSTVDSGSQGNPAASVSNVGSSSATGNLENTEPGEDQFASLDAASQDDWEVQLKSVRSAQAAKENFDILQERFPELLGKEQLTVSKVEIAGKGTFFRVRIAGKTRDEAASLCQRLRKAGGSCFVTR